ncbi:MAG: RNA 2'-phosphotransferase [Solobacterium sp.]|nr:RNA 2'-phosphotransferase [Solobacterium sp.]
MEEKLRTKKSRFLSLILRHHPEKIGITLDEHGWADVKELREKMNLSPEDLEEIVRLDAKGRYRFDESKHRIRAVQGHSIPVDVGLRKVSPPAVLYHGTGEKSVSSIMAEGLKPMGRLYVHLSPDLPTARTVGSRHGSPVVFLVLSEEMEKDGYAFYRAENGVWLTEAVPVNYLVRL